MAAKILTIVVSYNGEVWLTKCLSSLQESSEPTDVMLIDNASTDGTVQLVKNSFPNVQCIALPENKGFGAANNVGLKIALAKKYDFVFLLNQDAYVTADCLEQLVNAYQNDSTYGILSPWQYAYEAQENETYFNDFVIKEYCKQASLLRAENDFDKIYETSFAHAAAWFMPIATIAVIGGFDPLFFYTGEDNDYVQRLQANNLAMGIVPAATVHHKGTNTALLDPNTNEKFFYNIELLKMKLPQASTKGALALFVKNTLSRNLQARRKSATAIDKLQAKVYRNLSKKISAVLASRKEQIKKAAYL